MGNKAGKIGGRQIVGVSAAGFGMESVVTIASETYMHGATWSTLIFRKITLEPVCDAH